MPGLLVDLALACLRISFFRYEGSVYSIPVCVVDEFAAVSDPIEDDAIEGNEEGKLCLIQVLWVVGLDRTVGKCVTMIFPTIELFFCNYALGGKRAEYYDCR